jgi:hypothetical protein
MKARYAHEVGIGDVYQHKTGTQKIEGPPGGGHVFTVHSGGKDIELSHGFNKIPYRSPRRLAIAFKKKAQAPYPETHKVKVYGYAAWIKGNFFIQGMIHLSNRNESGIMSGPVLQKEEI